MLLGKCHAMLCRSRCNVTRQENVSLRVDKRYQYHEVFVRGIKRPTASSMPPVAVAPLSQRPAGELLARSGRQREK
eukprot:194578-Chlamydomonas_euryale.AAC.4